MAAVYICSDIPSKGLFPLPVEYDTLLLRPDPSGHSISQAAKLLLSGQLVAIPTETVYGLAAAATLPEAVKSIFIAKGRPQDNPLIVHIADPGDLPLICPDPPESALRLAELFWPGPLTMVLPKSESISSVITAGLDTVAIRCPAHSLARAIIRETGVPLVAPSANTSGTPSPTTANHVMSDLKGKIAAVFDGGSCDIGIESTVVDMTGPVPRILRPGGLSEETLLGALGKIEIAYDKKLPDNETPPSPGMKYRHYSPGSPLTILRGSALESASYIKNQSRNGKSIAVLCFDDELDSFRRIPGATVVSYGRSDNPAVLAKNLFSVLRALDSEPVDIIYARMPEGPELAAAVRNRLVRASGGHIIDVD